MERGPGSTTRGHGSVVEPPAHCSADGAHTGLDSPAPPAGDRWDSASGTWCSEPHCPLAGAISALSVWATRQRSALVCEMQRWHFCPSHQNRSGPCELFGLPSDPGH